MPISKDPEKAARQLANLRKGPPAAASKGLPVDDYPDPPGPGAEILPAPDPAGGNGGLWVMLIAGAGLLAVLVFLNRPGTGRDE